MKEKLELNDKATNISAFPTVLTWLFGVLVIFVLVIGIYFVQKNNVDLLPINKEYIEKIIQV